MYGQMKPDQKKETKRTYQKVPVSEPQLKKTEDRTDPVTRIPSDRNNQKRED